MRGNPSMSREGVQLLTVPLAFIYYDAALFTQFFTRMAEAKSKKMSVSPVADRVLVKREEKEDAKTSSGIIIPDTASKEKSKVGTVIATGPGRTTDEGKLIAMSIKPGAKVIFNAGWDNEVDMGDKDEEYFLVRESDILAIIK
jgi:chaperonin GroES